MAKTKVKKPNKQRPKKQAVVRSMQPKGALDAQALAYARLLRDPCGAPLVHPVYSGADGGILARFETDFVAFNGATITSGYLTWTPGALGVNGANASQLLYGNSTLSSNAATVFQFANSQAPGNDFLPTQAMAVRCVSACMQIYWPGTELNRQGYVMYGNTNGVAVKLAQAISTDAVGVVLQHTSRIPQNMIEVKWRPGDGDQMFIDPTTDTAYSEFSRRNAIAFAVKGLPVATGLRIRLVAVYEYQPDLALGIVNPTNSRNTSNNSLDQVINFLDKAGSWTSNLSDVVSGMSNMAVAAGVVNYGGRRRPAIRV